MAFTRIIHWLGNSCVICAVLMIIAAIASFMMLDIPSAMTLSALTMGIGVFGVILIATTHNTPAQETVADAMLFLLLFWIKMPFIMALPYLALGVSPNFISVSYTHLTLPTKA